MQRRKFSREFKLEAVGPRYPFVPPFLHNQGRYYDGRPFSLQ